MALLGSAVRDAGVPLAFWLHDAANGKHWLERWASWTRPDVVIANSRFTASTLPALYPGIKAQVVYCPVSRPASAAKATWRSELRTEFGAKSDAVIVQVSRMEPYKGHKSHLEALAHLRDVPGWQCWMVGGPQRPHERDYFELLQSQARESGIADRVRFLGQRSDINKLLAAFRAGGPWWSSPPLRAVPPT